jgi:four helix bundle protein
VELHNGFRNLLIYQKTKFLIKETYGITKLFPHSEKDNLVSQINRAVISVALNIVEGHRRRHFQKEFFRFLTISDGSLAELEACFDISNYLGFVSDQDFERIEKLRSEVAMMLNGFMKKVRLNL